MKRDGGIRHEIKALDILLLTISLSSALVDHVQHRNGDGDVQTCVILNMP